MRLPLVSGPLLQEVDREDNFLLMERDGEMNLADKNLINLVEALDKLEHQNEEHEGVEKHTPHEDVNALTQVQQQVE